MQILHINREACPREAHADIPPPSPQSQNINGENWRSVQSDQFNGRDSPSIVLEKRMISKSTSNPSGTWSPFERSYSTSSSSACMDVTSLRTAEDDCGLGLISSLQLKDLAPNSSPLHFLVCSSISQGHFLHILHPNF